MEGIHGEIHKRNSEGISVKVQEKFLDKPKFKIIGTFGRYITLLFWNEDDNDQGMIQAGEPVPRTKCRSAWTCRT